MIDERTLILMRDMALNAKIAIGFIEGQKSSAFELDLMRVYATRHAALIVAEAAYQIDSAAQASTPGLPWRSLIAFRHRIVHGYRRVTSDVLFTTIKDEFPPLIAELERILNESPPNGR